MPNWKKQTFGKVAFASSHPAGVTLTRSCSLTISLCNERFHLIKQGAI